MVEYIEYAKGLSLCGAEAVCVVEKGLAVLKVGAHSFRVGDSPFDKVLLRQGSEKLAERGYYMIDFSLDVEYQGRLDVYAPKRFAAHGMYVLVLEIGRDNRILLTTGVRPAAWPEKTTADMGDVDYFKARMMHGKPGVYHYRAGLSRLSCDGEVWDCGPFECGEGVEDARPDNVVAGHISGEVVLFTRDNAYALVLAGFDGTTAFIKTGNWQRELDQNCK